MTTARKRSRRRFLRAAAGQAAPPPTSKPIAPSAAGRGQACPHVAQGAIKRGAGMDELAQILQSDLREINIRARIDDHSNL